MVIRKINLFYILNINNKYINKIVSHMIFVPPAVKRKTEFIMKKQNNVIVKWDS